LFFLEKHWSALQKLLEFASLLVGFEMKGKNLQKNKPLCANYSGLYKGRCFLPLECIIVLY